MAKTCAICGKPSGMYPLCKDCFKLRDEGKIIQCSDCKTWHYINKPCNCTKEIETKKEAEITSSSDELTCIICGNPSNGKHFCYNCYQKYKNRKVDIRITNCTETEIIDAYGNLQYKCDDGRKVRSKSEKIISDFLFKYKIRAVYEKEVYYYTNDTDPIILKPDFYLPDYDLYIEHNGLDNKAYKTSKSKTEKMYEELKCKVVVTTEADLSDIEAKLKPILKLN